MKKTIFSFAIAAVAALMVSCGGKTENAAGGETTAEGEQATEQVVDAQAAPGEITGPVTIETKNFSIDLPAGWYVKSPKDKTLDEIKDKRDLNIAMKEPLKQGKSSSYYAMLIQSFEGTPTEQEYIDTYVKNHSGAAAGDAITIDGKQAKHFAKVTEIAPDDKKEEHCITVATSNGFIGINTYGMELSIEDVQKIIASIKVK